MIMWHEITSYIKDVFNSYSLSAILLELLLIGFVVYSVMRFLRGTGGEKLLRGSFFYCWDSGGSAY